MALYKLESAVEIAKNDPYNKAVGGFYIWKLRSNQKTQLHIGACKPSIIKNIKIGEHLTIIARFLYDKDDWIQVE